MAQNHSSKTPTEPLGPSATDLAPREATIVAMRECTTTNESCFEKRRLVVRPLQKRATSAAVVDGAPTAGMGIEGRTTIAEPETPPFPPCQGISEHACGADQFQE